MAFFRSPNCVAEEHHRCVDGAALHCVCPCHREANQRRQEENDRKDAEMDRRIIEGLGLVYDPKAMRLVKRAS